MRQKMYKIIECIPNFSEGRNEHIIQLIKESITKHDIKVRGIERGVSANRTVITFAGEPEQVTDAAYEAVKTASELIDMRKHKGEHPRMGATDVLPIVPIKGVTMEECTTMARNLAEKIYKGIGIPCYCYENAAFSEERKNLAWCRQGGWESVRTKIETPELRPDFSPSVYTETAAKSGITCVGAREILIAVNFNLSTVNKETAHAIACNVRESGKKLPGGNRIPGKLKGCKAIGWYIDEYGFAQVSMNITDRTKTSLYEAFKAVSEEALKMGCRVRGTEIIGLVPLDELIKTSVMSGKRSRTDSTDNLIDTAVEILNLNDIKPFDKNKVLEYAFNICET